MTTRSASSNERQENEQWLTLIEKVADKLGRMLAQERIPILSDSIEESRADAQNPPRGTVSSLYISRSKMHAKSAAQKETIQAHHHPLMAGPS